MNLRRVFAILLALLVVLSFAACDGGGGGGGSTAALTGIAVSGILFKDFYFADDDLSSKGLTVTAIYEDGSTRAVTGFTHDLGTQVGLDRTTITINYTEGGITKTAQVSGSFHVAAADARPTEVPKLLSGYEGTLGTTGTYYIFGDFPQTVAPLDENGKEINKYTPASIYRGYYLGSDGYFYDKCKENGYDASTNPVYYYSDDSEVQKADASPPSERYFKVEPIKWRVLNTKEIGNKILLAESTLTANIPYYGSTENRGTTENPIYPNNYKYSNIRAYLNGKDNQYVLDGAVRTDYDIDWSGKGFLQLAFTEKAQNQIATTNVDNSVASTYPNLWDNGANNYACDDTEDKIFLLSVEEATTADYGFTAYNDYGSGNSRIRKPTDYALANYAHQSPIAGCGGWWWLRSPYNRNSNSAYGIDREGDPDSTSSVGTEAGGVVPALSLSIGN